MRRVGFLLCALLLTIVFGLFSLLSSEGGSLWVLSQVLKKVPALSLEGAEGSFTSGLKFEQLKWTQLTVEEQGIKRRNTIVTIVNGNVTLRLLDALMSQVTVESFHADEIQIEIVSAELVENKDTKPRLPAFTSPVTVSVKEMSIKKLTVLKRVEKIAEPPVTLDDIVASFTMRGQILSVNYVGLVFNQNKIGARGEVASTKGYPLNMTGRVINDALTLELDLSAEGPLESIAMSIDLHKPKQLPLSLNVFPFNSERLFQGGATIHDLINREVGDVEGLHFDDTDIVFSGVPTLIDFNVSGTMRTTYEDSDNRFRAKGTWNQEQEVNIKSFSLVFYEGLLSGVARIEMAQEFLIESDVTVNSVQATEIPNPISGVLSVAIRRDQETKNVNWDFRKITLTSLLGTEDLTIKGHLRGTDQTLFDAELEVKQTANSVLITGGLNPGNILNVKTSFNKLQTLHKDIKGSLYASATLTGGYAIESSISEQNDFLFNWKGKASIATISIRDELEIKGIDVAWDINKDGNTKMPLSPNQPQWLASAQITMDSIFNSTIGNDGVEANSIIVDWSLNDAEQSIKLNGVIDQTHPFHLSCFGTIYDISRWNAICDKLIFITEIDGTVQDWQFDHPIQFSYSPDPTQVVANAFCLQTDDTSLCSTQAVLYNAKRDFQIPLAANNIPWRWLSNYLPRSVELNGAVSATSNVFQPAGGLLNSEFSIISKNTRIRVDPSKNDDLDTYEPVDLVINSINADGTWSDARSDIKLSMITDGKGTLGGELALEGSTKITGKIAIDGFDLGSLALFLEEGDNITGKLNTKLALSGLLSAPNIKGDFNIDKGGVQASILPVALNDITLSGIFDQSKASFDGTFTTPGGDGQVKGAFDWSQLEWFSSLYLQADRMELHPNDKSSVWVTPTITVKAKPFHVDVSGEIVVPKARIEIGSLAKVAATRSSDVVILDQGETTEVWQYTTDVNVRLGDDVKFKGFGVEGVLLGQVSIKQSNHMPLSALGGIQLKEGKYAAFGQSLLVRQGDLIFAGQLDNPTIKIDAIRENVVDDSGNEIIVGIKVTGKAQAPILTVFSDTAMSEQYRLSYLLTGLPPSEEPDAKSMLSQAAIALSLSQTSGKLSKVATKIGVDDFQLGASTTGESEGELRLSGRINDRLYVQYGLGVFDSLNSLLLRYQLRQGLFLEAVSGQVNSLDLMFTFDRD